MAVIKREYEQLKRKARQQIEAQGRHFIGADRVMKVSPYQRATMPAVAIYPLTNQFKRGDIRNRSEAAFSLTGAEFASATEKEPPVLYPINAYEKRLNNKAHAGVLLAARALKMRNKPLFQAALDKTSY